MPAVASLAREIPDPTVDDDHIRDRIINALAKNDWCPNGLSVIVRDGIVHLTCIITDERSRQAAIVGAAVPWLFAACVLQIRVGHLTKPAEHMLAI